MSKRRRRRRRPSRSFPSSPASSPSEAGDEAEEEEDDVASVESTRPRVLPRRQRVNGAETTEQGTAAAAASRPQRGTQQEQSISASPNLASGTDFGIHDPNTTCGHQEPSGQGAMNMAHGLQRNGPPAAAQGSLHDEAGSATWKDPDFDPLQQCSVPIATNEATQLVEALAQHSLAEPPVAEQSLAQLPAEVQELLEAHAGLMVEVEEVLGATAATSQAAQDALAAVQDDIAFVAALHVADSGYGTSSPGSDFDDGA
eukprot:m.56941 g.56941  ORF g.56941 m.56941 type:complete len:257 (-) comp12683_c1_seq1:305-1075(-)